MGHLSEHLIKLSDDLQEKAMEIIRDQEEQAANFDPVVEGRIQDILKASSHIRIASGLLRQADKARHP